MKTFGLNKFEYSSGCSVRFFGFMVFIFCWAAFPIRIYGGSSFSETNEELFRFLVVDGVCLHANALINVNNLFFDIERHSVEGGEYVSFYKVLPSNSKRPMGFCGAGVEIWLYIYLVYDEALIEVLGALISSCLNSFSIESHSSGEAQRDYDFSSVRWNDRGFAIQWFNFTDAAGRSIQRSDFVLSDRAFERRDVVHKRIWD